MAELMAPVNADKAVRAWGAFDIWSKLVEQSLSDDQIGHWRDRMTVLRQRQGDDRAR
ncbi:MAG: hypothetical protein ACJ72I_03445 [Pseudonocardiaceae bacterium]|jgi:hypothetical protein